LPSAKAEYLPLLVSGLTAAISIDKVGQIKAGDVVLVTAAAGGTGQFAVQWAKLNGAKKVLGTCSTDDKIEFLKSIGCDRPINYKTEDLNKVLKEECPQGVDIVYESVGGSTFDICLDNLAVHGRLIIIGSVTGYQGDNKPTIAQPIEKSVNAKLLVKSASLRGFFLLHFAGDFHHYIKQLIGLVDTGKMKSFVDLGKNAAGGKPFKGVKDVVRAVEYLYSQKSIGKVVVEI